jgi:hypothetical protein
MRAADQRSRTPVAATVVVADSFSGLPSGRRFRDMESFRVAGAFPVKEPVHSRKPSAGR